MRTVTTRVMRSALLAFTLGLILAHYLWSASSSGNPFVFTRAATDYYNRLTDSLLAGRVSMPEVPSADLLALPDPYDSTANRAWRLTGITHDLSLYEGRYYLYFGITPAVVLYAPFRMLAGLRLPENLAIALLLFGGVAWGFATLQLLVRRLAPAAPFAALWQGLVLLGFSNFAPFVLRRPAVYEVALAGGVFFATAGTYWLMRGITSEPGRLTSFALASLAFGLAMGSRPTQVVCAGLLAWAWVRIGRRAHAGRWRSAGREALALGLPFALCLVGVLLYNHARFGAFIEFGMKYQLTEWNQNRSRLFSLSYLPFNLGMNLLRPPRLDPEFPFFHVDHPAPVHPPRGHMAVDPVAGVVACVPLALLVVLLPLLARRLTGGERELMRLGVPLAITGVLILLLVSTFGVASLRYLLDFTPLLLLAAAIAWIGVTRVAARWPRPARVAVAGLLALLLAYGCVLNLAIGMTGYYDWLARRNPATYERIASWFGPLQRLYLSLRPRRFGDLRLTIRAQAREPGTAEVIVATGGAYRHDVVCMRHLEGERVQFKFHHRGFEPLKSRPLPWPAGETRTLDIAMGSLYPIQARVLDRLYPDGGFETRGQLFKLTLDGEELLRGSFDFVPSPPALVLVGRDLRDNGQCESELSGELLRVERGFP